MNGFNYLTRVKETCNTSVQDQSYKKLQHMWENVLAYDQASELSKRVPRHVDTPYITNPMNGVLEPLLAPQRKYYRLSRLCGRSQGKKVLYMYKWGGIYSQG